MATEAPAPLPDMMQALQLADAAGNHGDAKQIAELVQTHYPDHVAAQLGPPPGYGGRPGFAGDIPPPLRNMNVAPPMQAEQGLALPQPAVMPMSAQQAAQGAGPAAPPLGVAQNGAAAGGPYDNAITGWMGSSLNDFARSAVAAVPFNLVNRAVTAPINALATGQSYGDSLAAINQQDAQSAARSPTASAAGTVYGNAATVLGGGALLGAGAAGIDAAAGGTGALAGAAQAANVVAAPAARAAAWVGAHPFLGGGVVGAGAGGIDAAAHGGGAMDIAASTAGGAVTGALVGKGADVALGAVAPLAGRAWAALAGKMGDMARSGGFDTLADKFAATAQANGGDAAAARAAAAAALRTMKVDPAELAQTHAQMVAASGGQPVPLAAALEQYGQAQLAKMAATSPELGNQLATGARDWAAAGPTKVPQLIDDAITRSGAVHANSPTGLSGVQQVGDLEQAQSDAFEGAFNPIRGDHVEVTPDDFDALNHPQVRSVLNSNKAMRGRFNDATEAIAPADEETAAAGSVGDPEVDAVLRGWGKLVKPAEEAPQTGSISLDDLDKVRRVLTNRANGNDPVMAEAAREARDGIRDIATRNDQYAGALDQYGRHGAYIDGFKAGQTGNAIGQVEGATRLLNQPTGPAFFEGHASGLVSGLADKAAGSEAGSKSVLQTLGQNNATRANLEAAYGPQAAQQLGNIGGQLSRAQAAIDESAPKSAVGETVNQSGEALAHAGVAAATHAHTRLGFNLLHAVTSLFKPGQLSPAVGEKLASMMADPAAAPQAIALMQRHGVEQDKIQKIVGMAAGLGGGMFGHGLNVLSGGQ